MIIGHRAHLSFYNCRFIYSLNTDRFFVSTKQFVVYANNIEPQAEYLCRDQEIVRVDFNRDQI